MKVGVLSFVILGFSACIVAAEPIGEIDDLDGVARASGSSGERDLRDGDDVFLGDEIITDSGARLEIEFNDDTRFEVGGDSRITLDEFIYAGGSSDRFAATLFTGAMRFVSGAVAGHSSTAMTVGTPIATIGVRGTTAAVKLEGAGGQFALLESNGGKPTAIEVSNSGGRGVVDQPNFATTVAGPGQAPTPPAPLSRAAMDNLLGALRAATSGVSIPRVFGR